MNKFEAEYKLEVLREEFDTLLSKIFKNGFFHNNTQTIKDYFFDIKKSKHKGLDFTRIRLIDSKEAIMTRKTWVEKNTIFMRFEEEKEIDYYVAKDFIRNDRTKYLYIKKKRINFYNPVKLIHIAIDKLEIPDDVNYLVEAEIISTELNYKANYEMVKTTLEKLLPQTEKKGRGILKYACSLDDNFKEKFNFLVFNN
jgi:hypothetical protein